MDAYIKLEKLGEGTYGKVYKGRKLLTSQLVAMKKVCLSFKESGIPKSYLREISMLKELRHMNIVNLEDVIWEREQMYLIFEFLKMDLREYLDQWTNGLPMDIIQSYLYQITKALLFCHQHRILHRDLKPENLLIDDTGIIKIADFGLGRTISVPIKQKYSPEVVTIWYRAPELLLGSKFYAGHLDIWSLGCIFAEMKTSEPLFTGDSEIEQIYKIFKVLSTPTNENWPDAARLANKKFTFPNFVENQLPRMVPLDGSGYQLLEAMLTYDPSKRISAKKILEHQFFGDFNRMLIAPNITNEVISNLECSSDSMVE